MKKVKTYLLQKIYYMNFLPNFVSSKGKSHLITDHTGSEGNRFSYTLSLTSELDGGGWSRLRPGRCTPGKETHGPFYKKFVGSHGQSVEVQKI